jgi:hypothetical protein
MEWQNCVQDVPAVSLPATLDVEISNRAACLIWHSSLARPRMLVGSQVPKVAWWGKVIAGGEVIDHLIGEKNGTKDQQ